MNVTNVKNNIRNIFTRREKSLYALALYYAALALNYFRSVQPPAPDSNGQFWYNRTGQAAARMFTDAEITKEYVSWYMSHGVQYGVYLELANDRKHAAINPIIQRYAGRFINDVKKIFGTG